MVPLGLLVPPFTDCETRPLRLHDSDRFWNTEQEDYLVDGPDAKPTARLDCFPVLRCAL